MVHRLRSTRRTTEKSADFAQSVEFDKLMEVSPNDTLPEPLESPSWTDNAINFKLFYLGALHIHLSRRSTVLLRNGSYIT
jgi:hypothetical protein